MFFDYLIRFSIKNKFLIVLFVLGIIGWGSYALLHIPIDAVPDITNNQIQVITYCPNLAPQEIEQFVTSPIEIALASTPQLQEIRSLSRFGLSVVTVVLEEDVPIYLGRQWLTERLENAKRQIPPGLGAPELAPPSTGLGEIYQYTLHIDSAFHGKYSLTQLRTYQDWIIKRRLLAVPGVAEISSFGGLVKQYEVALNPEKMKNYGVSFTDVWETLQKNNENTGGAYIEKESHSYFIRGIGLLQTPKEIEQLTVKLAGGFPIRIAQIARVQEGSAIRYGALTENGEEACGGIVLMRKGENPAEVTTRIKKEVTEIEKSLPPGITIKPFLDRTRLVNNAIHTVRNNLLEGGLIVIFVLVLLLGNLRAGIIVALCIPLSLLFALGMMYWLGVSANLMSLGAIDFGLIVDGAVIMVESVLHYLQGVVKNGRTLKRGAELDDMVIEQACRIRKTAAFGELIIMIVYLPLLTLSGIEGKMFIPMALAVTFAIMGAFILSLTFVPMASAWALANIPPQPKFTLPEKIIAGVALLYLPALRLSLKFRFFFLGLISMLFIGTLYLFITLGGQFIPTLEEGDLALQMTILPGSSLKQSIQTTTAIEKLLLQNFPEVRGVVSKIGSSEIPTDPMSIETADIMILLKDKKDWVSASDREKLVEKMEKTLSILPVVNFSFQQPIQMRFNELMTGTKTDIGVMIYGEDLDTLANISEKIKNIANSIEGAADIYVERQTGLPQIAVNYYPEKLAQYGISRQEVNFALRSAFAGAAAGVIYEGEKKFDLVLRLDTSFRKSIHHIAELYITLPLPNRGVTQVPLFELASVTYEQGPMQINRERGKRRVIVGVNVRGKDIESVILALQKAIAEKISLPIGYHIAYGGEFENLKAAKARLQFALPLALALIFILLYFTLHSVKQTIIIFMAIPLAAIGGVWGLWLRDMPFSISAGVGFIALFGVAVLNGIVLMGYFNELEAKGMPPLERIYQGVKVRLRPVLMTALVAALGFLPMAVSTSGGAEVQRPLATVVIAGLISATVLTLFILPILYGLTHGAFKKGAIVSNSKKIGIFSLLLCAGWLNAQPAELRKTKVSLTEALLLAKESNKGLQAARLETQQSKILQKTAFNPGKTQFNFSYGNVNEPENDYVLGFTHQMPFFTYYRKVLELARSETQLREANEKTFFNQIGFQVKSVYYQLLNIEAQEALLKEQDSIFTAYDKATQLRAKIGDIAPLEAVTVQMKRKEIENAIALLEGEKEAAAWELGALLGDKIPVFIAAKEPLILPYIEERSVQQNPVWRLWEKEIQRALSQKTLEKAYLLPDIQFGLYTQSLYGLSNGFTFFQLGLGFPIWQAPFKARIAAADIQTSIVQKKQEAAAIELENTLEKTKAKYQRFAKAIQYFQETALPQASLLLQTAQKSYSAGEIDYLELVIALNQALQTRKSYLETIRAYNQNIIEIEFLTGLFE